MKTIRLKTGERGYRYAVNEALYGVGTCMVNPQVRFNADDGFFACPASRPYLEDEEVVVWNAGFSAKSGKPYTLPSYNQVRAQLLKYA